MPQYALSLKQPWAALLVHGLKTVEVRKWATRVRGPVLIHAARLPDERPEAWKLVPPELLHVTTLRGGIIGLGNLVACIPYWTRERFEADRGRHLNDPSWFEGRHTCGFVFTNPTVLPFRPYPGQTRFFRVEPDNLTSV
jgi:hypothetical protein